MQTDPEILLHQALQGERRSIARVLSAIEDGTAQGRDFFQKLFPRSGGCWIIGVTGPAGAGKSTLVDQLAQLFAADGKRVGIVAVDPSSPFSGGAVLGDRIRMSSVASHPQVYIRSMAARGMLGGLAPRAREVVIALGGLGFEVVILETVGVGQSEVEVVQMADSVVVTLVPGMGDAVQALKAGILEIADIFVINKADFPGVEQLQRDLLGVLRLAEDVEWSAPIIQTVASSGKGVEQLFAAAAEHRSWLHKGPRGRERRLRSLQSILEGEMTAIWDGEIMNQPEAQEWLTQALNELERKHRSPYQLASEFFAKVLPNLLSGEK